MNDKKNIYTKGDVLVNKIKIGDIHIEYGYGMSIKVEVISIPVCTVQEGGNNYWTWQSKIVDNPDKIIDYGVSENHSHYAPELYNYDR